MAKSYTKLPGFCFSNTYCAISALFTLPLTFGIWYCFYYMSQPGQLHFEAAPQFMFARIGLALLIWRFFTYYLYLIVGVFTILLEKIILRREARKRKSAGQV